MITFNRIMAVVFLVAFISWLVWEVAHKPRVLILHSYDDGYLWVREVDEGINRVIGAKPYTLRRHYMDTKKHPDAAFKKRAGQSARNVIDQWKPHIILAVADNAQDLVARHYVDHPSVNIVFSGVFGALSGYGYEGAHNVTGIQERWPMAEIRKGIEDIFYHGKPLKVRHLGDRSTTGLLIADQIRAFDWGPNLEVTSVEVDNFIDWQSQVRLLNETADLALFSLYHTLTEHPSMGDVVSNAEVMAWTGKELGIPGVGGWGFFVEQGGMMAIGVSAFEQGEEAARMAIRIIDGEAPDQIPHRVSRQFLIYLREPLLRRHKVEVPRIFEAFARATNNYYEK